MASSARAQAGRPAQARRTGAVAGCGPADRSRAIARAALTGPRMGGRPAGAGVRWRRASRIAAASQGAASGTSGSTGAPYGQKVTGRPWRSAGSGRSGVRRMPARAGCAATARRRERPAGSVPDAWALATVSPWRTTVPSGRSARTLSRCAQAPAVGWAALRAPAVRAGSTSAVKGPPGCVRYRASVRSGAPRGIPRPPVPRPPVPRPSPRARCRGFGVAGTPEHIRIRGAEKTMPAQLPSCAGIFLPSAAPPSPRGFMAGCPRPDRSSGPGAPLSAPASRPRTTLV